MSSYTVEHRDGVILVQGSLPIDAFANFATSLGRKAIADPHLARLDGVTFAFGLPDACGVMRKTITAKVMGDRSSPIGMWQQIGEHGMSSKWLYTHLEFERLLANDEDPIFPIVEKCRHPSDPSDLRRCRLMLEMEPQLQPLLHKAKGQSAVWDALLNNWDSLCATMDEESPDWRTAPGAASKTYDAMRSIIDKAEGRSFRQQQ